MAAVQDFDDELLAIHRDWVAKWAIARPAPLVEGEDEPVVPEGVSLPAWWQGDDEAAEVSSSSRRQR
jgi:hypothetical protein